MATQVEDNLHVSGNKDHSNLHYLEKTDFKLGYGCVILFYLKGMKITFFGSSF